MNMVQAAANYGVTWRFRNPGRVAVVVIVLALLYSLRNLKNAWPCIAPPVSECSIEIRKGDEGHYESRANCCTACSLGLQHARSEPGRRECPAISTKSTVAFEDLIEGDYIVRMKCEESGSSCYAEPQEFPFHMEPRTPKSGIPLRHIPPESVKLVNEFTGQCSKEQVWRSRMTCSGILYTLTGAVVLIISYTERLEDEHRSPRSLKENINWVLRSRVR